MINFTEPVTIIKDESATRTSIERALAKVILEAVAKIQESSVTREIVAALEAGDVAGAVERIRFDLGEDYLLSILPAKLRDAYEASGLRAAAEAAGTFGAEYSFNIITPQAVEWVRRNAGALIQQWGDSSRDAMRRIIADGFERGIGAGALARQIKQSGVGLTWRMSRAVLRMRHRLEEDGRPADQIERMTTRYFNRLLKDRAEMIARTEMTRAMTHARLESWRQAIDKRLLDPTQWEKEWLATHDSRTCERCLDLDGTRAAVPDGVFIGDSGTVGGVGPGYHPRCRCVCILVERGSKQIPRAKSLQKMNPYHVPSGSPEGGQFTTGPGSGETGGDDDVLFHGTTASRLNGIKEHGLAPRGHPGDQGSTYFGRVLDVASRYANEAGTVDDPPRILRIMIPREHQGNISGLPLFGTAYRSFRGTVAPEWIDVMDESGSFVPLKTFPIT